MASTTGPMAAHAEPMPAFAGRKTARAAKEGGDESVNPTSSDRRNDLVLARQVASGDRRAAERFARRLFPVARRVARTMCRHRVEADDAAQNVLVELLGAAKGYAGRASLESWAYRIAVRVVMRGIKKTRVRGERYELQEDAGLAAAETGGFGRVVHEDLPRPLSAYLAELTDVQREVMVLRHAMGHTIPEISDLIDTPVPTIKSRLQKAQSELRRMIRRDLAIGVKPNGHTPAASSEKDEQSA